MSSTPTNVAVLASLLLLLSSGLVQRAACTFSPHEFGCSAFTHYLGPQRDWRSDLLPAYQNGNFAVIIHGVVGAGKSSIAKLICGKRGGGIGIRHDNPETSNIRSYTANSARYESSEENAGKIFVIDTPGFREPNIEGQMQCLEGMDRAHQLAKETGAPLKRVYFVLDWTDPKEPIPANLGSYLRLLSLRYDVPSSKIVFIVSKCDLLQTTLTRDAATKKRDRLPSSAKLLFIQSKRSDVRNAAQLCRDLVKASGQPTDLGANSSDLAAGCKAERVHFDWLKKTTDEMRLLIALCKFTDIDLPSTSPIETICHLHRAVECVRSGAGSMTVKLNDFIMEFTKKARDKRIASFCPAPIIIVEIGCHIAAEQHENLVADAKDHLVNVQKMLEDYPAALPTLCA